MEIATTKQEMLAYIEAQLPRMDRNQIEMVYGLILGLTGTEKQEVTA